MRGISGINLLVAVAILVVACGDGDGDDDPPRGTGGDGTGGAIIDGPPPWTTSWSSATPNIHTWEGDYVTYLDDFNAVGFVYTYPWQGATCTLSPAAGEKVTSDDYITVSGCVDDVDFHAGGAGGAGTDDPYSGGGWGFAFCAAPTETWDELTSAIPDMATWEPESKHTWAECNPNVNLLDVTVPGLPACAQIDFQDAMDIFVTDKNSAVSVNVNVDGEKGCEVVNLDLSYVFVTD